MTPKAPFEKRYVYKSTLSKVYGLTPRMIYELGEPDETCDNPYYQNGAPASLYLIERVESWVEANKERVAKARESRARRSAATKEAHARRKALYEKERAEMLKKAEERVRGMEIVVKRPLPETLLEDAQERFRFRGNPDPLTEKGLHAHVRHRLTNYEALLRELHTWEFSWELYSVLRKRVDAVVKDALAEWQHTRLVAGKPAVAPLLSTERRVTEGALQWT